MVHVASAVAVDVAMAGLQCMQPVEVLFDLPCPLLPLPPMHSEVEAVAHAVDLLEDEDGIAAAAAVAVAALERRHIHHRHQRNIASAAVAVAVAVVAA
jgi:hypothetical protein